MNNSLQFISLDSLWIAVAFILLATFASIQLRRARTWPAIVAAGAFSYCVVAQAVRFALQFGSNTDSTMLRSIAFVLSRLWPAVFVIGAFALVALALSIDRRFRIQSTRP